MANRFQHMANTTLLPRNIPQQQSKQQKKKSLCITHSISKYKLPVVVQQPLYQRQDYSISTKTHWTKEQAEKHIQDLKDSGIVEGATVITKYGGLATVDSFKHIDEEGLTFFHAKYPCIVALKLTQYSTTVMWSADEFELLKTTEEGTAC